MMPVLVLVVMRVVCDDAIEMTISIMAMCDDDDNEAN